MSLSEYGGGGSTGGRIGTGHGNLVTVDKITVRRHSSSEVLLTEALLMMLLTLGKALGELVWESSVCLPLTSRDACLRH